MPTPRTPDPPPVSVSPLNGPPKTVRSYSQAILVLARASSEVVSRAAIHASSTNQPHHHFDVMKPSRDPPSCHVFSYIRRGETRPKFTTGCPAFSANSLELDSAENYCSLISDFFISHLRRSAVSLFIKRLRGYGGRCLRIFRLRGG